MDFATIKKDFIRAVFEGTGQKRAVFGENKPVQAKDYFLPEIWMREQEPTTGAKKRAGSGRIRN
ncbi:hypothetical protein [Larkinella punicea]|uniref:Uncharacterized protein n=1 Tax=Larkinella punicea TaxID=2315727 RepID=A0A368JZ66_9BACT|nr:hypothetical protein [Larkinella punicea]RCR71501.1 hypothetical protein DUE52_00785 [Larkinella punicea]